MRQWKELKRVNDVNERSERFSDTRNNMKKGNLSAAKRFFNILIFCFPACQLKPRRPGYRKSLFMCFDLFFEMKMKSKPLVYCFLILHLKAIRLQYFICQLNDLHLSFVIGKFFMINTYHLSTMVNLKHSEKTCVSWQTFITCRQW